MVIFNPDASIDPRRNLIAALPNTADGFPVVPGDALWTINSITGEVVLWTSCVCAISKLGVLAKGGNIWQAADNFYHERDAAEAVAKRQRIGCPVKL